MIDLIVANKAFILKALTGILGTAFAWVNKKYSLGVDPVVIASAVASIILGVALHAGLKDHGATAAAMPDAPAPVAAPKVGA